MSFNKYHVSSKAQRTVDNIVFDSKAEANRYGELKILWTSGEIGDLVLQPEFVLLEPFTDREGKKHRAIKYQADFSYRTRQQPEVVIVEDVKGHKTPVYKLKKKLLLSRYPNIVFKETEV
jgi:hypothetical protein